jgi:hypothetical protein
MQKSDSRLFDCGAHEPLALRLARCSTSAWVHFNGRAELYTWVRDWASSSTQHTHTHSLQQLPRAHIKRWKGWREARSPALESKKLDIAPHTRARREFYFLATEITAAAWRECSVEADREEAKLESESELLAYMIAQTASVCSSSSTRGTKQIILCWPVVAWQSNSNCFQHAITHAAAARELEPLFPRHILALGCTCAPRFYYTQLGRAAKYSQARNNMCAIILSRAQNLPWDEKEPEWIRNR